MYVYHLLVYLAFQNWAQRLSPATGGEIALIPVLCVIAMAIAATAGVAALSFRFIETPFLRLKRFFPSPSAATGALIVVLQQPSNLLQAHGALDVDC